MKYAKIIVKNDYENENDLLFRPLIRAYQKIGATKLIENGKAVLLGTINEDGKFYELFTKKQIDYVGYFEVDQLDIYYKICEITTEQFKTIRDVINNVIFNEKLLTDIEVSTMDDLASDRRIEFDAYNRGLSNINPYSEPYNGYNDFSFKLQKIREYGK